LSILITYTGMIRGIIPSSEMIACLQEIDIPSNDSVVTRIMNKLSNI
jgi:hypothetical protein